MLESLSDDRIDHKKPRHDGITYIIDKFQGFDKENFETISSYNLLVAPFRNTIIASKITTNGLCLDVKTTP